MTDLVRPDNPDDLFNTIKGTVGGPGDDFQARIADALSALASACADASDFDGRDLLSDLASTFRERS